jgi:hypothetical protein
LIQPSGNQKGNYMSVQNGAFTRTNLGAGDGSNHPRFFLDQVQDMVASEKAGRAIFRDEERVEIIMPGNPHTRPVARVTDEHRQRWPREYAAFREGIELAPDGTPLEEWSILKRSQVMELKALGFKTVEHIRDMDDLAVQRIGMGGRRLKEMAGVFLDDADRVALTNRLAADNERKDEEIAALRRQIAEMGAQVEARFAELQAVRNAPPEIATMIPGMADPVEQARQAQPTEAAAPSSLDSIATPRRRGRPALPRDAAGNVIREAS